MSRRSNRRGLGATRGLPACALGLVAGLAWAAPAWAAPASASRELVVGSGSGHLAYFNPKKPETVTPLTVTGLVGGIQGFVGLDVRPSKGRIYGLTRQGVTYRLYTLAVNLRAKTATAKQVGSGVQLGTTRTSDIGMTFDAAADGILVVDASTNNVQRINPESGVVTDLPDVAFASGDANFGANPGIDALAATGAAARKDKDASNKEDPSQDDSGDPSTQDTAQDPSITSPETGQVPTEPQTEDTTPAPEGQTYGIDQVKDVLVRLDTAGGSSLQTVGPLGVNTAGRVSFAVAGTGKAYAKLSFGGQQLYTIDLDTGSATRVGPIVTPPGFGLIYAMAALSSGKPRDTGTRSDDGGGDGQDGAGGDQGGGGGVQGDAG